MIFHSSCAEDPYMRPAYPFMHRVRRLIWNIAWLGLFRFSPVQCHFWRVFILRLFGAKIGRSNFIYPSSRIWAPWLLSSGDVVTVGPYVEIYNPGGLVMYDHVILSQGCYICGASHDFNHPSFPLFSKSIVLGRYSWVCARAVVLPGVVLGDGAVLGASAVAAKSLDPLGVYVGNPARKVAQRSATGAHSSTDIKGG